MSAAGRRLAIVAVATVAAGTDLAVKAWVQRGLPAGGVEGGPVDLRLAYNTGVAFSFGAGIPTWVVVAVTAAISLAVAAFAFRVGRRGSVGQLTGFGLVLGGAVANLVDRAADGRVTDYLHTGWWPTFNLADAAIVTGGLLLASCALRATPADDRAGSGRGADRPGTATKR